jgi:hypothetical protein
VCSNLRLKSGDDYKLEEEAAAWLAKSREGVTALSEKRDYLTYDQLQLRAQREILNQNGVPDESLMSGLFRRAFNPNAHCRPNRRHTRDE